jgi:hypothetical protein
VEEAVRLLSARLLLPVRDTGIVGVGGSRSTCFSLERPANRPAQVAHCQLKFLGHGTPGDTVAPFPYGQSWKPQGVTGPQELTKILMKPSAELSGISRTSRPLFLQCHSRNSRSCVQFVQSRARPCFITGQGKILEVICQSPSSCRMQQIILPTNRVAVEFCSVR